MIHPTAVVSPGANVDPSCEIGPYTVIDEHVIVGAGCRIGPHVFLTGWTTIGSENQIHAGCVIGDAPQDLKYRGEHTRVRIGNGNVFREHVTVHRSNSVNDDTVIGSGNLFMAHCHVGHNSHLGDNVILANGALLGGHVVVEDRVFISGNCMLHQFVRVGTLALMQGGSGISKDLPPFTIARGNNGICGLNTVGLRRAGLTPAERLQLRQLYHALFRRARSVREGLEPARAAFRGEHARMLLDFVAGSKRGVCTDVGRLSSGEKSEE